MKDWIRYFWLTRGAQHVGEQRRRHFLARILRELRDEAVFETGRVIPQASKIDLCRSAGVRQGHHLK